ncbi:sugar phosphate isomerase/epimerase [Enterobacterales bacterium AW_CKDN230030176-1A_HGKHYDSX7]
MHPNPVSISLSSYGATLVRQQGQGSFLPLLAAAGVDRVELREELFVQPPDAAALVAALESARLTCVYSSPLELWTPTGTFDERLPETLAAARALGAVALKVSLGYYQAHCDVAALKTLLKPGDPQLLVENDQTQQGGRVEPLLHFFERAQALSVPVGMTFDIGNWQWRGESALQAARLLGRWVRYVHCKAVERAASGRLAAVPPQAFDLKAWETLFDAFAPGVPRAVEYPLVGDDLLTVTRDQVRHLRALGAVEEVGHA